MGVVGFNPKKVSVYKGPVADVKFLGRNAYNMDSVPDMRAYAKRVERLAKNKVTRNRSKGVELDGSHHNPVRGAGAVVESYNRVQLRSYIAQLEGFIDRKTQFKPDMNGRPLPAKDFRKLKQAERKFNNQKLSRAAAVGGIMLPAIQDEKGIVAQQTVKERRDNMATRRRKGSNPAVNNP
jgi:hypothetical protein